MNRKSKWFTITQKHKSKEAISKALLAHWKEKKIWEKIYNRQNDELIKEAEELFNA